MTPSSADDEYPIRELPTQPLWCENYAFSCFDAKCELAMIALLGRWPMDTTLWRELLLISLGDERIVCARHHGRAASERIAAAAMFEVEIVEPGRALRLRYDGPAAAYRRCRLSNCRLLWIPMRCKTYLASSQRIRNP